MPPCQTPEGVRSSAASSRPPCLIVSCLDASAPRKTATTSSGQVSSSSLEKGAGRRKRNPLRPEIKVIRLFSRANSISARQSVLPPNQPSSGEWSCARALAGVNFPRAFSARPAAPVSPSMVNGSPKSRPRIAGIFKVSLVKLRFPSAASSVGSLSARRMRFAAKRYSPLTCVLWVSCKGMTS